MHSRQAQVTLEYFILFTIVAVLSIGGIAALRDETVGVRKTVQDFTSGAITRISAENVEPPAPPPPPVGIARPECGMNGCEATEECRGANYCEADCGRCDGEGGNR